MPRRRRNPFALLDLVIAVLRPFARLEDSIKKQRAQSLKDRETETRIIKNRLDAEKKALEIQLAEAKLEKMKADTAAQWNRVTAQDIELEKQRADEERSKRDQDIMDQMTNQ